MSFVHRAPFLIALLAAGACNDFANAEPEEDPVCEPGTSDCPCAEDDACADGLVCSDDVCVDPEPAPAEPIATPAPPPEPVCTPICAGRECGDNGCEGTCGSCSNGYMCSSAGRCIAKPAPKPPVDLCRQCIASCQGTLWCCASIGCDCYDVCAHPYFTPNIPCDPMIQICS